MRESLSACKELVNPGGSGWGWGVAPRPLFAAVELSGLLAPGPALSLHAWMGDCCKSGVLGGSLVPPEAAILSSTPAARSSKICLRRKPLDGSAAKRGGSGCASGAPCPSLPDHPIPGKRRGAAAWLPAPSFYGFFHYYYYYKILVEKNNPRAAALPPQADGKAWKASAVPAAELPPGGCRP